MGKPSDTCPKCSAPKVDYTTKSGENRRRCPPCDNARRSQRYHDQEKNDPVKVAIRKALWHERQKNPDYRALQEAYKEARLATPEGQAAQRAAQLRYDSSEKGRSRTARARITHYDKALARRVLCAAVERGVIQKPEKCQRCGCVPEQKSGPGDAIQGHHHNGYDEEHKLDVIWLCRDCHAIADKDGHGE